jgi:enolase
VVSIEDPFEQDDWEPAVTLTAENTCQVLWRVGDSGFIAEEDPKGLLERPVVLL